MTKPYVIAEVGANHNGDIQEAHDLIDMAALAGANAVKFQKRDNPTLFTDEMYHKPYMGYGDTYGTHRAALELDFSQFVALRSHALEKGLNFLVTPFDVASVDFLEDLGVLHYKIASASVTNHILLERIRRTGKPAFMSVGGQSFESITKAMGIMRPPGDIGPHPLVLLHCVAVYPCPPEMMNLMRIPTLSSRFDLPVGLSDHQDGIALGAAAYALGARVFEKHITLNHSAKGTDHAFSLEYEGLRKYIKYLNDAAKALEWQEQPMEDEIAPILKMSQSLYWARAISAGDIIQVADIAIQSPGHPDGLYPTQLTIDKFAVRELKTDVARGQILEWDNIK